MAYIGRIFPQFTKIEIDENGNIWQTFNNAGSTVIEELDAAAHGIVFIEEMEDIQEWDDSDPFDELWTR